MNPPAPSGRLASSVVVGVSNADATLRYGVMPFRDVVADAGRAARRVLRQAAAVVAVGDVVVLHVERDPVVPHAAIDRDPLGRRPVRLDEWPHLRHRLDLVEQDAVGGLAAERAEVLPVIPHPLEVEAGGEQG